MSPRARICFVSMEVYPNLKPGAAEEAGGAGFQIVQLASGLKVKGHEVSFVVGDYGQGFEETIDGYQVYRSNKVAYDRSLARSLSNLVRLFKAMRAARADHYVLRSTRFLSFFVMLYAKMLGARYTFMVANLPHCLRGELESLPRMFGRLYEISLNRADRVTVQSREQQKLLKENFGIEGFEVPNGIAVPPLAGPRAEVPYDFCWVASFKIQKRADVLIDIARLLPERKFLVVGGPGPDRAYSQKLMDELRTLPNVTYEGFVTPDKVGEVYERARIFLNTSDWEGFPNGFLYAWTRGLPACALKINPDGAVTGKDLGLVDEDATTLAFQMDQLLDDPDRYESMARRCHDHVREHHSLEHAVDVFITALPS